MDAKTLEAMEALWVDITPESPVPVPTAEEAAEAAKKLAEEGKAGVEVKDDSKPDNEDPKDWEQKDSEPESEETKDDVEVWNDKWEFPEWEPKEDEEPEISNDSNPDLKTETREDPNEPEGEGLGDEPDLDEILKSLEEMTNESLESWTTESWKTEAKIKEKLKKASKQEWDPVKQSKTLKEIVDLNVKLQQELAIERTSRKSRDEKLKEITEELNTIKYDDSRVVIPEELKGVNNYLKKFRETSNETFKIKVIQEAVDMIENLTGKPLKWNYLDDYIEDSLKWIEELAKKQTDEIARWWKEESDPALEWAKVHGVPA